MSSPSVLESKGKKTLHMEFYMSAGRECSLRTSLLCELTFFPLSVKSEDFSLTYFAESSGSRPCGLPAQQKKEG